METVPPHFSTASEVGHGLHTLRQRATSTILSEIERLVSDIGAVSRPGPPATTGIVTPETTSGIA